MKLQTPANDDNGPPTAWIHVCHHHWNPKIAPANSAPSPVQSYRPLTNIPATPPARENVPYDSGGIQNRFGLLGSNIKPDVSGNFESEPSGLVMSTTQLARVQNTDHEPIPFASTGPSLGALEGKNLRLAPTPSSQSSHADVVSRVRAALAIVPTATIVSPATPVVSPSLDTPMLDPHIATNNGSKRKGKEPVGTCLRVSKPSSKQSNQPKLSKKHHVNPDESSLVAALLEYDITPEEIAWRFGRPVP